MSKRVLITGCGVLASNGKGREEFWQAIEQGTVGYQPITLFGTEDFLVKTAGEISDFNPKKYFGPKGLRTLDRSTKLLVSASKLAVADCGFEITDDNTDDVGVAVGTTLGSVKSISDFDEVTLREGPQYTNPALFPNTVINSSASQVSIWNNIQGFNTTVSTGFTASLDALQYAYDFLQMERVKLVFAGGVEELCPQTFFGFHATKYLSGSVPGEEFINCPFDRRRNGATLGEGACLLALEEHDQALARGAQVLGEIVAFSCRFDPARLYKVNPRGTGLKAAIREVLDEAGMSAGDIDYICANANSCVLEDKVEAQAIRAVFGKQADKVPVSSVKSMVGETYSLSGAMAVSAALGALQKGFLPPNVNYREPDPDCRLNIVTEPTSASLKNILIINFGPGSNNTCLIIRRF